MHYILGGLETKFPMAAGWRSLVSKVCCTQLFVNPLVFLPLFYGWTGAVLGRTTEETVEKVRKEGWDTLMATWAIFTPFNVLNFSVIPVRRPAPPPLLAPGPGRPRARCSHLPSLPSRCATRP